jgi:hypothetical protein
MREDTAPGQDIINNPRMPKSFVFVVTPNPANCKIELPIFMIR